MFQPCLLLDFTCGGSTAYNKTRTRRTTTMKNKSTPHTDWRAAWDRVNAERARLDLAPYGYEFANDTDIAQLFCNVLKSLPSK